MMDMENSLKKAEDSMFIPMTSISSGKGREINNVFYYTNQIVNIIMIGDSQKWVLVDTGLPRAAKEIVREAERRFGPGTKPEAILLTHGHFDHVGNLVELLQLWEVPVYAHPLEHAYLQGIESYPTADASVQGGGLLAKISPVYPHKPVDVTPYLRSLPADNTVPGLPDWKWIHTPGHSRGHISFFREEDHVLLAGDAFVTVRQDSLYKVLSQKKEVNGPPNYLTVDWDAAWDSIKKLETLKPEVAICGHGTAMGGNELAKGLVKLVKEFDQIIPEYGKFVNNEK